MRLGRSSVLLAGLAIALLATVSCSNDGAGVATGFGRPKTSSRAGGGQPTPGPSSTSASGGAGAGSGATAHPIVTSVSVGPSSLTLWPPAEASVASPSVGQLTATVHLSDGTTNAQVTWYSAVPTSVTVSATGTVTVRPGAPSGGVAINATSVQDGSVLGQAFVLVQP